MSELMISSLSNRVLQILLPADYKKTNDPKQQMESPPSFASSHTTPPSYLPSHPTS